MIQSCKSYDYTYSWLTNTSFQEKRFQNVGLNAWKDIENRENMIFHILFIKILCTRAYVDIGHMWTDRGSNIFKYFKVKISRNISKLIFPSNCHLFYSSASKLNLPTTCPFSWQYSYWFLVKWKCIWQIDPYAVTN